MSDWYKRWAAHHAECFTLSETECSALKAWELTLAFCYSDAELHAATDTILREPGLLTSNFGKIMERHLAAIKSAVHQRRMIVLPKEIADLEREDRGVCCLCNGSGRVSVPRLECIRAGEWRPLQRARMAPCYYTHTVLCSCALGNWYGSQNERLAMRLQEYEQANPRWKIQLEKRRREQLNEADTEAMAAGNPTVSEVIAGLTRRFSEGHEVPSPTG